MKARGALAEEQAARFLERQGIRIEARNWRCRFGEIDLVARDADTLVFVEVRARASRAYGGAAQSIDATKRRKLSATAAVYLRSIGFDVPCRFDAILLDGDGRIEWIRDAFRT